MPRGDSAKAKIRAFLEANVGTKVTSKQISEVSGIIAHARRVRELRDESGMRISTHKDRTDLKPGEYLLESLECRPVEGRPAIPKRMRNEVLDRDGSTCQICGAGVGEPDAYRPGKTIRLVVDHILPVAQGGRTETTNLRALCNVCDETRQNVQPASETAKNILARIRKLPRHEQREILDHMKRSFHETES
jgi:hypothetical protein